MIAKPLAALAVLALLAGCADARERELSEQVMAAKVAALKAQEAQAAAEKAAAIATGQKPPVVEDTDAEEPDENTADVDTESFVEQDSINPARANTTG